jgi:hypothetical protein
MLMDEVWREGRRGKYSRRGMIEMEMSEEIPIVRDQRFVVPKPSKLLLSPDTSMLIG